MKIAKQIRLWLSTAMVLILTITLLTPAALADTNGQELKITDQPDKLVLELGKAWACVEFELKLDSGTFPVPVVVNESGTLTMELGGSKTYTLICLSTGAAIPVPASEPQGDEVSPIPESTPSPSSDNTDPEAESGIPTMHLVLFIGGFIAAAGGLIAMYVVKRRRSYYDDDDDEYDDE